MKFFRRIRSRRPRKYLRRKGLGKKRVAKSIKRYVKKQIHRSIENKEHIIYGANQSIQTNDYTTMTYGVLTALGSGTDSSARIGNQVKITKGYYRCSFNLLPYNATTNPNNNPMLVKVWLVRDLAINGQSQTMDSTAFGQFFRGNGVALGFQGNTLDMCLDVNKDRFRVLYSKQFKLGTSNHISGADNANGWFDNSPVCKQLYIPWSKHCKKQLKFNDGTGYPINENLYLVVQAVPCDGTGNSGKTSLEWHYCNTAHYEDA